MIPEPEHRQDVAARRQHQHCGEKSAFAACGMGGVSIAAKAGLTLGICIRDLLDPGSETRNMSTIASREVQHVS